MVPYNVGDEGRADYPVKGDTTLVVAYPVTSPRPPQFLVLAKAPITDRDGEILG
jgi:hypothetical protein